MTNKRFSARMIKHNGNGEVLCFEANSLAEARKIARQSVGPSDAYGMWARVVEVWKHDGEEGLCPECSKKECECRWRSAGQEALASESKARGGAK